MATAIYNKSKRSPLTPPTITPPYINRQHSYNSRGQNMSTSPTDATSILAKVASRPHSPRRPSPMGSMASSVSSSSEQRPHSTERRRSWEDCKHQHDGGYISFPDFDSEQAAGHQSDEGS
ncbi:hypothetical protein K431DRAFT_303517 [Polychaeton citri CBS 116435]|uniref:Uncharacterized protein n=1 Tax=Polychaeton citri CBS 116435 TaxID=1314669 RepID=A0A9P4Q7N7_9PEZI|nr:hypothetical protein K431DRAFT_303517 [Polychaeton citri CBS 116435]